MEKMVYELLRDRCREIQEKGLNQEGELQVISAYETAMKFQHEARREGILALDLLKDTLNVEDPAERFFAEQVVLVVDGMDSQYLREIGMNRLMMPEFVSYEGLRALIFIMQAG